MTANVGTRRPPDDEAWPALPLDAWRESYATLHMWTQVVGKIRLELAPMINHWWQVPLYVTARGLTTSPIPHRSRAFEIDFDFIDHALHVRTDEGDVRALALEPRPVAEFYRWTMRTLDELGLGVDIWTTPVEVAERIPFEDDVEHGEYDPAYAHRFWRILVQAERVLTDFRSRFVGKASPVHFFWGAFDLAATRFSGRRAPPHPGAPNVGRSVVREAYSHEVSSAGFWPGGGGMDEPAFYAYGYPEPDGFRDWAVRPDAAYFHPGLREFVLPYDAVRAARDPDASLLEFLQTSYEAAAELADWDRAALERR